MGIGLFAMRRWHAAWRTTGPVALSGHYILSHWDSKAPVTLSSFKLWDCLLPLEGAVQAEGDVIRGYSVAVL